MCECVCQSVRLCSCSQCVCVCRKLTKGRKKTATFTKLILTLLVLLLFIAPHLSHSHSHSRSFSCFCVYVFTPRSPGISFLYQALFVCIVACENETRERDTFDGAIQKSVSTNWPARWIGCESKVQWQNTTCFNRIFEIFFCFVCVLC